jgi:predicted transposase YbfD/YdcC
MPLPQDPLHPINFKKTAQKPLEVFRDLPDPRSSRNLRHKLFDVFAIAICAILCGANDWVKVAAFGRKKKQWLASFLDLSNGVPSHDTFDRVFRLVDPEEFEKRFVTWTKLVADLFPGEVVAIDGKTLRGSHDKQKRRGPIHCVSAFASSNQLVLGQLVTEEKSNEITTIPKLLDTLAISGCLITIDAMGCQRAIAEKIIESDADYLLALKGNQTSLADEVANFFNQATSADFEGIEHVHYLFQERNRGRQERREVWVTSDVSWLPMLGNWKGLRSIMMIKTERIVNGKTQCETRLYICSLSFNAAVLKTAARDHWAIENTCHWVLDVTYQEDKSRVRKGFGAENLSRLKRLTLNLLMQDKTSRESIATKRFEAALDDEYRERLLENLA